MVTRDESIADRVARAQQEAEHAQSLASRYGLEYVDVARFRIDNDLLRSIPFDLMLRYHFIPEGRHEGRLAVVLADPTDVVKLDELEMLLGEPVEPKVGARTAIEEILQKSESVQRVLDDPEVDAWMFSHRHIPEMPLGPAIAQFYTADVFMHTWDLARATGQDERLDAQRCRELYEGMLPMDEILRASGQYGPKVDVPDDADWQTKMLAFIGRHV